MPCTTPAPSGLSLWSCPLPSGGPLAPRARSGDDYTGLGNFLPEQQDRATLEHAIAAVPTKLLTRGRSCGGTVEQAVRRLREYQAAGLEHVVLSPVSGLVSPGAALEGLYATGAIARALLRD